MRYQHYVGGMDSRTGSLAKHWGKMFVFVKKAIVDERERKKPISGSGKVGQTRQKRRSVTRSRSFKPIALCLKNRVSFQSHLVLLVVFGLISIFIIVFQ